VLEVFFVDESVAVEDGGEADVVAWFNVFAEFEWGGECEALAEVVDGHIGGKVVSADFADGYDSGVEDVDFGVSAGEEFGLGSFVTMSTSPTPTFGGCGCGFLVAQPFNDCEYEFGCGVEVFLETEDGVFYVAEG